MELFNNLEFQVMRVGGTVNFVGSLVGQIALLALAISM
jgi:hypothetical protein